MNQPDPTATEMDQLRTENERMRHELEVMYGGAFDDPKPEPTDRAAVRAETLREAADAGEDVANRIHASGDDHRAGGAYDVVDHLRRLASEQPTNSKAPTDRAAIERAFAERLAAELAGCCTECDACIEIAQHLAGKDEPAAEERKQPPMDPVYILGIDGEPAPVAEPPVAADDEETLVHVGWWCWRGNNHGHLATVACRSDNVPIHVPAEWADEMRAVLRRIEDGDEDDA
ncbi:hypothetical protein [Streptomyces bangladeshensis]|uniref:Uncharacterized protein n=1 Tax=Streptomyces bangladeshensis TaxID=295352 RepID=A0ABN3BE38_9ACTN